MFKNAYSVTLDEVEIHWSKDVGTFWTHIAIIHGFFYYFFLNLFAFSQLLFSKL